MLISELIKELETAKEEYGDVPLCEYIPFYGEYRFPAFIGKRIDYCFTALQFLESLARKDLKKKIA